MKKFFLFIIFIWGITDCGYTQIHVAPTAVYLNKQRSTGRIEVLNTGSRPVEITVDIGFGYPQTDADGNIRLELIRDIPSHEPSATDWVQIYPYRFTLPAGLRQTIRFAVFAPDSIPEREYWARPLISARTLNRKLASSVEHVQARLNIVKRTILSLNYRHGDVYTAPVIDSLRTRRRGAKLTVQPYLQRSGNAAVLGNLVVTITDLDKNKIVRRKERLLAVYHQLNRVIQFPMKNLSAGKYRVTAEVNSNREGPRPGVILPFETVRRSQIIEW